MRLGHVLATPPPWRVGLSTVREFFHIIPVSTSDPLVDTSITIYSQKAGVAFPHFDSRVVPPPATETRECPPDLVRLDALFAKSTVVKSLDTLNNIRVGGKGHHSESESKLGGGSGNQVMRTNLYDKKTDQRVKTKDRIYISLSLHVWRL